MKCLDAASSHDYIDTVRINLNRTVMNKLHRIFTAALVTLTLHSFANTCPALSGEVMIGKSPGTDFTTITEAVEALNCGGVSGPVNFKIESGTYNEKVVLSTITGVSAFNPIKFESLSGNNEDVVITYAGGDAAFVISSSNISLENITVSHTQGTYGNCLRVEGKASNLNFRSVIFDGIENAEGGTKDATVYFTSAGSKSDVVFTDCEINYGSIGISKCGMSTDAPDSKTAISGSLFFGQSEAGLALANEDAPLITNNVVSTITAAKSFRAIALNNVSNGAIINKNIISAGEGAEGLVMNNCMASATEPGQINNNNISINGATAGLGIHLTGNTDNQIFNFNRVKLAVNATDATAQGYYRNTSTGTNVNMMNNLFVDTNTGSYTILGNSYKDFFNQLPSQSNPSVSASANSFSMEKVVGIK
jgi:hypothetical protein